MIEHLKETNTSWHNSHSFGMNFGAMMSFGMNPAVGSGMMAAPVVRNEKGYSIEETLSKSGVYARDKTVKIGKVIEITPTVRNEEKISVFDTSIINSIGGIASGVQEIKENWEAVQKPHHHDIIIDAEPVDVVQEHKEEKKPVIAVDAEPRTHEKQENFSIRQDEIHEIIDEIYYEDIAPYREFERVGSPDRVETELTKAVVDVIDHAKELEKHVNCYTKAVFQVVGYVSEAFSAPLKPVNEYVISPVLDALDTQVRRTLRDDCRFSQGFAQDAGDMSSLVAGLLIPCRISKVPGKITKLKVPDRVAQRKVGNVGKFRDLTKGAPFHDNRQAHHIPAKSFMKKCGINKDDGLSIMMTNEQHAKTRTFKGKAKNIPVDATAREELARDLWDVRSIMKEDGSYTKEVNKKLLDGVGQFKSEFKEVFKKEKK